MESTTWLFIGLGFLVAVFGAMVYFVVKYDLPRTWPKIIFPLKGDQYNDKGESNEETLDSR